MYVQIEFIVMAISVSWCGHNEGCGHSEGSGRNEGMVRVVET